MNLSDVGTKVGIECYHHQYEGRSIAGYKDVDVIMGIKAPKGQCFIFGGDTNNQCQAIKAFMRQHKDD